MRSFYIRLSYVGADQSAVYTIGIADDKSHAQNYRLQGFTKCTRALARLIDKRNDCVVYYYNGALVSSRCGKSLLH